MDKDVMMMEPCQTGDMSSFEEIDKDMSELAEQLLSDYKLNRDILTRRLSRRLFVN